jgi:Arc-like DNA binding domain
MARTEPSGSPGVGWGVEPRTRRALARAECQKITFVLPRQLIERLRAVAKRNRRSLVGELVWAVDQYLRQQESS